MSATVATTTTATTVGSIPIGDKSTPEDIASYFHGISKKDFKNAIGSLYKEGLVAPGGLITSIVADENRKTSKITAEATKKTIKPELQGLKPPRLPSDRDSTRSVFIGKLKSRFYFIIYLSISPLYVACVIILDDVIILDKKIL